MSSVYICLCAIERKVILSWVFIDIEAISFSYRNLLHDVLKKMYEHCQLNATVLSDCLNLKVKCGICSSSHKLL